MVKVLDLTRAEYDATCADILNSDRSMYPSIKSKVRLRQRSGYN
jgi:hypothetical protein